MELSNDFLIESKSVRDESIAELKMQYSEEQVLNKIKVLFFAVWQDVGRVSRQQLADFYEVSVSTIDSNYQRNKEEFESDGVKVLRGGSLKDVRRIMRLTSKSPQETIYTPAGALRMGFILRDSKVAKEVRTNAIRFIQGVGQQLSNQVVLQGITDFYPSLSYLVQGNIVKISSPYSPYWDKMRSTLKKQYSTGGIPGKSLDDLRKTFQFCSGYTDYLKLQGSKEIKIEVAGLDRAKYPHLITDILNIEINNENKKFVFMFQFQDLVIDMNYVQECIGRSYIQIAKRDLSLDFAYLIFVAPFGATSYAEDYIRRYLPSDCFGCVGVLTVKELADILYNQALNSRNLGTIKGQITKEFASLRNYLFPQPPAIYDQLNLPLDDI